MESNTGKNYDIKWSLDLIQDTHGNNLTYSYLENPFSGDQGAVYLSNITYNNDKLKVISFNYEESSRPDGRVVLEQGNLLSENRRLKDILISFNKTLVRRYSLGYNDLNNEKSMSAISNISYFGADNSSILNVIKFSYYETTQGFDNTTSKWIIPEGFVFSSTDTTKKDFGVRLLDVNNDGFPDLIKAKAGTHETKLNNKTGGWNDSGQFIIPAGLDIVDGSNIDQGLRFGDVDSDGLIDILRAKAGTREVYLNNGTGWENVSSIWSLPVDFIDGSSNDEGVELVDFNGDGKLDILKGKDGAKSAYINTGSGWQDVSSSWILPDSFVTSSKDTGLRLIDLNNDGLPDILKGGSPGSAWFNNGTGWISHDEYAPNLEFVDYGNSRPDLGVRFMDVNGDGLTDILQNFLSNVTILNETCVNETGLPDGCILGQNITFATDTKLNNGTGWTSNMGWVSPEKFTDQGYNIGRRIADVNGDGYPDILVAYQSDTYFGTTHIRNNFHAFLLKNVTTAYGGVTEITYEQSSLGDNGDNLGFNIWVVNDTTLNNSVGGDFLARSIYSYIYSGGAFDYATQEFRGFSKVNESLPDGSLVLHSYHQDSVLKGKEFETKLYDSSGKHFKDNFNLFSYSSNKMIFLNHTSLQIYDGELTPVINNISFIYDGYGNVLVINNSGEIDVLGDEKTEVFNYYYNATAFIVSKPSNYTLYPGNSSAVRRTFYYYDNLTVGVNRGDITKIIKFNDAGASPELEYRYDGFGNVVRQIDGLGYSTIYDYDSTGTHKIRETNALGHTADYRYDFGTGNLLSEVHDVLNKTYTYDVFGRIKTEIISPDVSSSPTKNYTYNLNGAAPESIKTQMKNDDGDYSEEIYFYDGFGNPLQIKALFDSNTQVVKNYFYDSKYRIKKEQNPYLEAYSTDLSESTSGLKTEYGYDSQDRVINVSKQDGSLLSVVFNRTLVTQYDENGNQIDYLLDAYDRIKSVTEYNFNSSNMQEVSVTNYTYKADDNLVLINDAHGNKFLFGYDSLGRKTLFDDPNMNPWTYNYDLNGNLIGQVDGRNVTTNLTYDQLNRVIFKKAGSINVSFTYDLQYDGTLSNITLSTRYSLPIYYQYLYDSRLRVVFEGLSIHPKETLPAGRETFNTTYDYDSRNNIISLGLLNDTFSYQYNSLGKLKEVNGFVGSISYNAFGKISNKTHANGLVTDIDYDDLGRISLLQTEAIQNLSYLYDSVGNVKTIEDQKNSKEYVMNYDNLNRMVNATIANLLTGQAQVYSYAYNSIGGLLSSVSPIKNITYTYSSLAHAPTNLVIKYPGCKTFTNANEIYVLQEDLYANATCFVVTADNISLDGNGHVVNYALQDNGYGLFVNGSSGLVVRNITLVNSRATSQNSPGIYLENVTNTQIAYANLSIAGRTSSPDSNNYGVYVYRYGHNILIDNTVIRTNNRGGAGIYFEGRNNITNASVRNVRINTIDIRSTGLWFNGLLGFVNNTAINNVSISTQGSESPGIYISGNSIGSAGGKFFIFNSTVATLTSSCGLSMLLVKEESYVYDSNISALNKEDICLGTGITKSINLINSSYVEESVLSGSLVRKWYYRAYVNDSQGNDVPNANVTAFNRTGNYQFNLTTDSTGFTKKTEIIDYVNASGITSYYSNYTIYADNISLATSHPYNVTLNKNNLKDAFTLSSPAAPIINNINVSNSTTSYSREDLQDGLIGWWRFDENRSVQEDYTDNPNNYDANVASSNAWFTTDGKTGGAYKTNDVDLEEKIYVPSTAEDFEVGNMTFAIWVKPDSAASNVYIFDHYNWRFYISGSNYVFAVGRMENATGPTNSTGLAFTVGSYPVIVGQWTYLAATYSPDTVGGTGNIKFYANGELKGTTNIERQKIWIDYGSSNLQWCNSHHGAAIPFNGTMDETRIYNKTLSGEEIKKLYSVTNPTFEESSNVTLEVTVTDEDTSQGSLFYRWFVDGVQKLAGFAKNVFSYIFTNPSSQVMLIVNDTENNTVIQNWNVSTTVAPPIITILNPINIFYKDVYSYSLDLNVSISDSSGVSTRWWTTDNGATNHTFSGNTTLTGLVAGSNTARVYANDTLGNQNFSSVTFHLAFTPKIKEINVSNSTASYLRGGILNGLVGWWAFDENRTDLVIDKSGTRNATFSSTKPIWTGEGNIGGAFNFTPNANNKRVLIGNVAQYSYGNISDKPFTFMGWARRSDITSNSESCLLCNQRANSGCSSFGSTCSGFSAVVIPSAFQFTVQVFNSSGNLLGNTVSFTASYSPGTEWHHYAITHDGTRGTNATLYIDGVARTITVSGNGAPDWFNDLQEWGEATGETLTIGENPQHSGAGFNGTIDEVRVYNRSLSASEIYQIYSVTNPTFKEDANVTLSVNITDEDTASANLAYAWFVDGVSQGVSSSLFNKIFTTSSLVKVVVTDSSGYNVTQNWNVSIAPAELEVRNLSNIYSNLKERVFRFVINNTLDTAIANVSWRLDTGQSNISSQYNATLQSGEDLFVYAFYNYTSSGTYTVIANAQSDQYSDSESIQINV